MPWNSESASKHTKKASTPKKKRIWASVANAVLKRTGDEGAAIREANGVVAHQRASKRKDK